MASDADLAGQDHAVLDDGCARDSDVREEQAAAADLAVVGDVHEIVDLGASTDARRAEARAVDGGVRADLDIVLQNDPTDLRRLLPSAVEVEAEPVGAKHGARVHDAALAHLGPRVQDRARHELGARADLGEGSDEGARVHAHPVAEDRAGAHDRGRADAHVFTEPRGGVDDGRRMYAGREARILGREGHDDGREGALGVRTADHRPALGRAHVGAEQHGSSAGGHQLRRVALLREERHLVGRRVVEARGASQLQRSVPIDRSAAALREGPRRDRPSLAHACPSAAAPAVRGA